jgi:hypothetical protein
MPSVEQVREFKALTGVFSAEFGWGAGVVSVHEIWRDQLRGTGYEFLRNDAFDARNFFVRKTVQPDGTLLKDPAPLDRHQFGGAIGGAVVIPGLYDGHSRTFFFADYAGIKERRGVTTVNTVPNAAARIGDFSNYRDRSGNLIPIYDPLTTRLEGGRIVRDPFSSNIIPADRINPVGRSTASVYPLPNAGSSSFDNYISIEVTDHAFSGRVDHKLSDSDSFFVRFNYGKNRRCRNDSQSAGARMRSSGGTCSTCSITPASGSRTPRLAIPRWDGSRRPSWTTEACSWR